MESDRKNMVELLNLEKMYNQSKTDYYRFVIRNEDKTILARFGKIPDNWEDYKNTENVELSEGVKLRLSSIKRKKSWELKLQSLYFFFITNIENILISVLQQQHVDEEELNEAIDSISNLILELDDELLNIKYLLLTLAKRSISDFYYLLSAYSKFSLKKNFHFETDTKAALEEIIKVLKKHTQVNRNIIKLISINDEISHLFTKSSNEFGWRMNEFSVKDYFERINQHVKISELNMVVRFAYEYKKNLLNYYSFLKFYYNENDGKLFRLNFIYESLKTKLDENKINREVLESFQLIRDCFINYKNKFEIVGLLGFGSEKLTYHELLGYIFKLSKIIEFYYLRNMKYESLQQFRNEILFYIEKEMLTLNS